MSILSSSHVGGDVRDLLVGLSNCQAAELLIDLDR